MAGETVTTIVGNLTASPELRFTPNGVGVANFTIASTPRVYDKQAGEFKDGDTLFMRCTAWRDMGEHLTESLDKGMRVIVQGRLKQRSFETKEGEKRTVVEMDVDEVGPSLKNATAVVTKADRNQQGNFGGQQQGQTWGQEHQPQGGQNDPWAASNVPGNDRPPF